MIWVTKMICDSVQLSSLDPGKRLSVDVGSQPLTQCCGRSETDRVLARETWLQAAHEPWVPGAEQGGEGCKVSSQPGALVSKQVT